MKRQEELRQQHERLLVLEREQEEKTRERLHANARFQLGVARPYNVDLDADLDDPLFQARRLVTVVPNPILATMSVIDQIDFTEDLLNRTPPELEQFSRSMHDTINITIKVTKIP